MSVFIYLSLYWEALVEALVKKVTINDKLNCTVWCN